MNPFTYIKDKIVAAWNYSRTVFVNVVGAVMMFLPDIVGYLSSFDFDAVFKHEVAITVGMIITMANIFLRFNTKGPIGYRTVEEPMPDDAEEEDPTNTERSVKAE